MTRWTGLIVLIIIIAACAGKRSTVPPPPQIMTVTGPITADQAGFVLPHEHLLVDFIGAEKVGPHRYSADEAFSVILPHLLRARDLGIDTLVECTPSYIGKDPALLQRLSEASGITILSNTGYYAAAGLNFVPDHAYERTAEELATMWIGDWETGIDGTDIRPGFIKIGVDGAPLPEISRKIIRAAAITQRSTGLTIAMHAPDGSAVEEALPILEEYSVPLDKFIWVHANVHPGTELQVDMGRRGMWVEFDGLSPDTLDRHLELVNAMKDADLLDRVLLSHDAGWYSVGEENGGDFRFFGDLSESFIPMLLKSGYTQEEIDLITRYNPARAFTLQSP